MSINTRLYAFVGGDTGPWRVVKTNTIVGEPLLDVNRLNVVTNTGITIETSAGWMLHGITSNERYVSLDEKNELAAVQQGLGRPEATCAG